MAVNEAHLGVAVDSAEANRLLRSLLSALPVEVIEQVFRLFIDREAPCQPRALFDHAFVIPERMADGAIDVVIGLRLRKPDEFGLAIRTLYAEKFVALGHAPVTQILVPTPTAEDRR